MGRNRAPQRDPWDGAVPEARALPSAGTAGSSPALTALLWVSLLQCRTAAPSSGSASGCSELAQLWGVGGEQPPALPALSDLPRMAVQRSKSPTVRNIQCLDFQRHWCYLNCCPYWNLVNPGLPAAPEKWQCFAMTSGLAWDWEENDGNLSWGANQSLCHSSSAGSSQQLRWGRLLPKHLKHNKRFRLNEPENYMCRRKRRVAIFNCACLI